MKNLIIGILMLMSIKDLKADHIMGADITYEMVDEVAGRYKITVSLYRSCAGILYGAEMLDVNISGEARYLLSLGTPIIDTEVTPICMPPDVAVKPITNCPMGAILANGIKGVHKLVYVVFITIGRDKKAILGWRSCCRNSEITTINLPNLQSIWVQAYINSTYVNSSPKFTTLPVPYWCRGVYNNYNHGAVDNKDPKSIIIKGKAVDRDLLSYKLYTPFIDKAANITDASKLLNPSVMLNVGITKDKFLYTEDNKVNFDNTTGSISCIPRSAFDQDAIVAIVVEEYVAIPDPLSSNGYRRDLAGYVCRDMQFTIRNSCDPIIPIGVIGDSSVNVKKVAYDKVDICGRKDAKIYFVIEGPKNETIKYKVVSLPQNKGIYNLKVDFNYKTTALNDVMNGVVTFDSSRDVENEKLVIEAFYCNNIGIKKSAFYTLNLRFLPSVVLEKRVMKYCIDGKPRLLKAFGAEKYSWSPKKYIVDADKDSTWILVAPDSNTTYYVIARDWADSTTSCSISDSVRIIVIPKFSYTLSPKVKDICLHDTFQVNINTPGLDTPYIFLWNDPTSGTLFNTQYKRSLMTRNPIVYPINSATYKVEITNKHECTLVDSLTVNLKGVVPLATGYSGRSLVCPGDSTLLGVKILPKTSGPSIYSCSSNYQLKQVKSSTPSSYSSIPNPYMTSGANNSSSTRIVYKKSELLNAGLKAGIIKSIAMNILNLSNGAFETYELRLGTSTSNDARVLTPTYTIYKDTNVHLISGWQYYPIARGFDWDGLSNLVVETHAKTKLPMIMPNQILTINTISGNEVAYKFSDSNGLSAEDSKTSYIGTTGSGASKPQLNIEFCTIDSSDTTILNTIWGPKTLVNQAPYIAPRSPFAIGTPTQYDSVFIAKVGTTQCYDTAMVRLNLTDIKLKATGGKIVCRQMGSNPIIHLSSTLTGNSAGYSILWTCDQASAGISINNQANISVSPTTNGMFKYIATATNAPCRLTDTVIVVVNDSLSFSIQIDSPLCTSNSGKLTAIFPQGIDTSNFNFTWSPITNNSTSISNLGAGNYTLQVELKSDPSCKGVINTRLDPREKLLDVAINSSGIRCHGMRVDSIWADVVNQDVNASYTHRWSQGNMSYKIISAPIGLYIDTIVDILSGCKGIGQFVQTEPLALNIDSFQKINILCKGGINGEIKAFVSGGTQPYTFNWSAMSSPQPQGFDQLIQLPADSFTLNLVDNNSCEVTKGIRIYEPTNALTIDWVNSKNTSAIGASDGKAIVIVSGGTPNYQIIWKNDQNSIIQTQSSNQTDSILNQPSGWYDIDILDKNGCKISTKVEIKDLICKWNSKAWTQDVACHGDSSGMLFFGAIDSANYLTTNWYQYIIQKPNGKYDTILKSNHFPTDTAIFSQLKSNNYNMYVWTDKGCFLVHPAPIVISQNPLMNLNLSKVKPSCFQYSDGQASVLKPIDNFAPYSYNWGLGYQSDSFSHNCEPSKMLTVKVKNSNGCIQEQAYIVPDQDSFTLTADTIKHLTCYQTNDGYIHLKVKGGKGLFNYQWANPNLDHQSTQSNLSASNYRVTVMDNQGCTATVDRGIDVTQPDKLEFEDVKTDSTSCPFSHDGSIDISARGGTISDSKQYEYSKDGGQNYFTSNKFANLSSGDYNISIRDLHNCIAPQIVSIFSPEELSVIAIRLDSMRINDSIDMGSQILLSIDKATRSGFLPSINNINWSPVFSMSCADCQSPVVSPYVETKYDLEVRYHKNCLAKSSIMIPILNPKDIFVPSVFSPNGDGVNDVFQIYGNSLKVASLIVFNRCGEKVFESTIPNQGWNGLYRGDPQSIGVYTYVAEVEYLNGQSSTKKGSVTLIK